MMLATPLIPAPIFSAQHTSEDLLQYRPSKDIEAFNSLLPPPIEFIEGSSSGAFAVPEGKYEAINTTPKATKVERPEIHKTPHSTPVKSANPLTTTPNAKGASLYPGGIDLTWPATCNRGTGLYNTGNTCFLNSALQCLLHTPPLLRVLSSHSRETCRVDKGFCMVCGLRQVATQAHGTKSAFSPSVITSKLQTIAKHMRKGRQEDSHEFLRYAIDALQKSCLAGHPPKIDPKLAETTWVHKIFGGRLRSRVTCRDCGHHSDTFDRILDLSLDIHKSDALKDALRKFVAVDHLRGVDKYKCEKCKKHVIAEKQFTVHEAPPILTVHLKRFSPLGRKIGHHVNYDDHLSLQPYMSGGQFGPSYSLYGVICHAGGGPNSGHYFAYIKSREGRWWEMNDEAVTPVGGVPINKKTAYMLFYMRNKGQGLEAAVNTGAQHSITPQRNGVVANMKRRRDRENESGEVEDKGTKITKPFIGPLLPSPSLNSDASHTKRQKVNGSDPQAIAVKAKIEAAAAQEARSALTSLESYNSDSDAEGEKDQKSTKSSPPPVPPSSSPPPPPVPPTIPPARFYGTPGSASGKKRKLADSEPDANRMDNRPRTSIEPRSNGGQQKKSLLGPGFNPYNRLTGGNTYSKKHRRRTMPRGV